MDTECPSGVQFWVSVLYWKLYGVSLYLAFQNFPAFAELCVWNILYDYNNYVSLIPRMHGCFC